MAALKITYKDPAQLKPRVRNPRTHTPKQLKQIAASIKEFGFPILIDGTGDIIAGHGRAEAAKLAGMTDLPTVYYYDQVIARFQDVYGLKAIHVDSGLDFESVKKQRSNQGDKNRGQKSKKQAAHKTQDWPAKSGTR